MLFRSRATCPIFGDGAAACMVEATTEDYGIMDSILRTDGKGLPFLHMKAGGSVCPPSYFREYFGQTKTKEKLDD